MTENKIEIQTQDGLMDAWAFHPKSSTRSPAVILHTDIRGVRPTFIAMAEKIAAQGYFVLLPNLYYRVGPAPIVDPAKTFADEATRAYLTQLKSQFTPQSLRLDHEALLNFLKSNKQVQPANVSIVGYCMSGAIALNAAADFPDTIRAVASFHGGRLASDEPDSPHLRAHEIKAKLYFGYAAEDASMSNEMIVKLEHALTEASVNFESVQYSGRHGFAVKDSPSYDPVSAEQHWAAVFNLLADATD
ncbi:MAG: dienelactone hydrolase family protein [Methylophilaceae bacterium]|jgi:carboxymethylenebutenolidase|nr:dienelactone hydrolase family protein [Methyloradius sp.]